MKKIVVLCCASALTAGLIVGIMGAAISKAGRTKTAVAETKALDEEEYRLKMRIYDSRVKEAQEKSQTWHDETALENAGMSSAAAHASVSESRKDEHEDVRLGIQRAEEDMREFLKAHPERRAASPYKDL